MRIQLLKNCQLIALVFFFQTNGFCQLQAKDTAMKVMLFSSNIKIKDVFEKVYNHTGWVFVYSNQEIDTSRTFNFKGYEISVGCISNQVADSFKITFSVANGSIVFRRKSKRSPYQGTVQDLKGNPISGVIITDSSSGEHSVRSNRNGRFKFGYSLRNKWLTFFRYGYQPATRLVPDNLEQTITMLPLPKERLDSVEVRARKKANSKSNMPKYVVHPGALPQGYNETPASLLHGRVPGVLVRNNNGASGSAYNLLLRGHPSIGITPGAMNLPDNNTLYQVDGVVRTGINQVRNRISSMANLTELEDHLVNEQRAGGIYKMARNKSIRR